MILHQRSEHPLRAVLLLAALLSPAVARAQLCGADTACMTNYTCQADGTCRGEPKADGTPCHGFDPCQHTFACQAGICAGTEAAPDGTPCGVSSVCASFACAGGRCEATLKDGSCDDHNPCTKNDRCQFGFCFGEPVVCPTPADLCAFTTCNPLDGGCETVEISCGACEEPHTCDPATGRCTNQPNGAVCNDFRNCTIDDRCQNGRCLGRALPTPTPPPLGPCVGDCTPDGHVTAAELLTGIQIALGNAPLTACPLLDRDTDGMVTIDELLPAVTAAVRGCSGNLTP